MSSVAQTSRKQELNPAFRVVMSKAFTAGEKASGADVYTKFTVEVADTHKKNPFQKLLVDSTGIGAPILSHCRELGLPAEGMTMHRKIQEEIFSNLKILFERRKLELPDSMELLSSLNCVCAKRDRVGGYDFSHPSGTHDDLAFALALAVWKAGKGGTVSAEFDRSKPPSWREGMGASGV